MIFQDKTLKCSDCGKEFTFSAEKQEYFLLKGYHHEPRRCSDCYQARNLSLSENSGYNYRPVRQVFHTICTNCGQEATVPFKPNHGRPVYCYDCYHKAKLLI